jgi:hypothetical protein
MLRDMRADWKRWTRTERLIVATISAVLAVAVPAAYLITLA